MKNATKTINNNLLVLRN